MSLGWELEGLHRASFVNMHSSRKAGLERYIRLIALGEGYGRDGIGFELEGIGAIHQAQTAALVQRFWTAVSCG